MDLRTYLAVIRKYLALIVAAALIGLLGGYALYKSQPKQYAAHVQFYVSTPVPDTSSAQSVGQFAANRMVSYTELLNSEELGNRVAKASGVDLSGDKVAQEITADTTTDSVLLTATVTDSNKDRALQIAQGVAKEFGPMVEQLDNAGRKNPLVSVQTVSEPSVGATPVAPKSRTDLLMGLGLGVLLALAYALFRELLDNSVKSEAAMRELAGAPVIGSIDNDKTAAGQPLLTGAASTSARGEAQRKLRTNLAFLDAPNRSTVIAFTSPMPKEGTSTVAANTAISFAESGERVLLVDADLRSAGVSSLLGAGSGVGLSNLLAGSAGLEAAVQHWKGQDRLDVLRAGELPPNPADLLGQPRFAALLDELSQHYDRIIIDTPALLPVADAAVVAGASDGVVLVTRAGHTTGSQVERSRNALEAIHARLLGVVSNRARNEHHLGRGESKALGARR